MRAHGEPLGEDEIRLTKRSLRLARGRQVPGPRRRLRPLPARASASAARSSATPGSPGSRQYKAKYPELADQLYRMQHRQLPDGWDKDLPTFPADPKGMATRSSSGKVLNALAKNVPWLIGGAADLAPSTKTRLTFDGAGDFEAGNYAGRNLHFGIREHAMGAILNGMATGQGPALRLRVPDLQRLRPDADPPGRDHGAAGHLRLHARLDRRRRGRADAPADRAARLAAGDPRPGRAPPGDANEVVEAWQVIMQLHHQPAVLILTRQDLPTLDRTKYAPASGLAKGAYILADAAGRQARRAPDGHRQRGLALRRGLREADHGRHQGPRREHAVLGALRRPGPGLPRPRPAARRHGPRLGRAGLDLRLGEVRRARRARASACGPSAPRPRSRTCSRSSASPSRRSWTRRGGS